MTTAPKNLHLRNQAELNSRGFSKISEYIPGDIPEDIDQMYSCGRCMYLATALNRTIGWPISVALNDGSDDAYIDHAWISNPEDGMMFDINGCYPEVRNSYVVPGSVVLTNLSADELFDLTIKTSGSPMSKAAWDAEVDDALVIVDQFFRSQAVMTAPGAWPEFLENSSAIAEYVADLSPYEISQEQIQEQYFGLRGRLTWIELSTLLLRSDDHNIPSKSRQKAVDSQPVMTMPPLLVDDSVLEDGYHRLRKLMKDGATHHLAYVIEEAPEPTVKKVSRWDSAYDITP